MTPWYPLAGHAVEPDVASRGRWAWAYPQPLGVTLASWDRVLGAPQGVGSLVALGRQPRPCTREGRLRYPYPHWDVQHATAVNPWVVLGRHFPPLLGGNVGWAPRAGVEVATPWLTVKSQEGTAVSPGQDRRFLTRVRVATRKGGRGPDLSSATGGLVPRFDRHWQPGS